MAATFLSIIPIFLIPLISPAYAISNTTAIRIGQGNCSGYPNSFPSPGDNADAFIFTPSSASAPHLNNLPTGIIGNSLVAFSPNYSSSSSSITSQIFCCSRGVLVDGFGVQKLVFSASDIKDEQLGYWTGGFEPETYALEVDGTRQNGTYMGRANVTSWGFREVLGEGYYEIRLLVPGGEELGDGEAEGFLKAVYPF